MGCAWLCPFHVALGGALPRCPVPSTLVAMVFCASSIWRARAARAKPGRRGQRARASLGCTGSEVGGCDMGAIRPCRNSMHVCVCCCEILNRKPLRSTASLPQAHASCRLQLCAEGNGLRNPLRPGSSLSLSLSNLRHNISLELFWPFVLQSVGKPKIKRWSSL